MPNDFILQRLTGIQTSLIGAHQAGASLSSASKGNEREAFIDNFLGNVLPPVYRFGTGDATDAAGRKSGQLDVVIEYPFAPSLPAVGGSKTRLYLAEGIAAVVEVKSDLSAQWDEVKNTARQLAPLKRNFSARITTGRDVDDHIPLFAVGYTGWQKSETCKKHLEECPEVTGIMIISPGIFSSTFHGLGATGPWSLWALISVLHITATVPDKRQQQSFELCFASIAAIPANNLAG
jgi:hypothetical protein